MKKRLKRRLSAVILALAVVISQSGQVLAAEINAADKESVSGNQEDAPLQEPDTVSNRIPAGYGIGSVRSGSDDNELLSEEAETDGEGSAEDEAGDASVSFDAAGTALKGMPEDHVLSDTDNLGKQMMAEHDVVSQLDTLQAGVDYVEDEVLFICDDPVYAQTVAEAYNGTLKSCELGVAVIKLDTAKITVKEAVAAGADPSNDLPPVDVNAITSLSDPVDTDSSESVEDVIAGEALAGKKEQLAGRDHSYWTTVMGFNDPGLDPAYIYEGNPRDQKAVSGYQWMHDAVDSYRAWAVSKGEGVTVAVIDSGVYKGHEELDAAGKVDTRAYSVSTFKDKVDPSGHGTHVAGIIAAEAGNGLGGTGIAPEAKILAVPIFNSDDYYNTADLIKAINYVTNAGKPLAQVINMSLGGPIYTYSEQIAVTAAHDAGITVCASTGNDFSNNMKYPGAYDNLIAVAAMDESWQKSDFSTYGAWADVAAPGTAVFSSWNGHDVNNSSSDYSYYASWDGTSMACPVVSGICALYISAKGGKADPDEVEAALKKSAVKVSSPYKIGAGMVNAANMLSLIEDTGAPSIDAPAVLASGSVIRLSDDNAAGKTLGFVYTVNGKKPAVKDGRITEGFYIPTTDTAPGTVELSVNDILNSGAGADGSVKLKALRITGVGSATAVAEKTFEMPETSVAYRVEGPAFAAKGKKVTYSLYPAGGSAGAKWSLEGAAEGVTINSKTGVVSIKKTASGGFTVAGEVEGKQARLNVKIIDPAGSLTLKPVSLNEDVNDPVTDRKGNLTSVRVYSVDIGTTGTIKENVLQLKGTADNGAVLSFASSDPSVVSVDGSGKLTGIKKGTARITCSATDGSGKKSVLTVKVIVPVSRLDMFADRGQSAVAYGKSMKLRPALGAAYGDPTIKKVEWEKTPVKVKYYSQIGTVDDYEEAKAYIRIVNGKLSVNKKIKKLAYFGGYFEATVRIKSKDGTGLQAEKNFLVVPPTSRMRSLYNRPQKLYAGDAFEDDLFYGDLGVEYSMTNGVYILNPEITSSNPEVLSVYLEETTYNSYNGYLYYKCVCTAKKKGKAVITVKATDGTGKKAKLKVTVR